MTTRPVFHQAWFATAFFCSILSLSFPCYAGQLTNELPVQPTVQEDSLWCWAAASVSLLNLYNAYPGESVEEDAGWTGQCLVVSKMYMEPGDPEEYGRYCCNYPDECTDGAGFRDIERVLEDSYDLDMITTVSTLSQSTLVDLIKNKRKPVMAILDLKNSIYDHAVLLVGTNDSGSQVEYMDPGDGSFRLSSYTDFVNNSTYAWTATLYPNGTPTADVYLRYSFAPEWDAGVSPQKVGWTYDTIGNIEVGPDYLIPWDRMTDFVSGASKKITFKKGFSAEQDSIFSAQRKN